jgi:hypothetical protein
VPKTEKEKTLLKEFYVYLPLKDYKPLFNASNEERNEYTFSPFGIHWNKLDEDLCFNGFIWK